MEMGKLTPWIEEKISNIGAHGHWYKGEAMKDDSKGEAPRMTSEDVEKIEEILGYHFKDPSLLVAALTHPSFYCPFRPEVSYERLEFMGDAVLTCLVGSWVFSMYPDLAPGPLTRLRAANVDTEKLARVAVSCNLHLYLQHKAPQLNEQIQEFMESMKEYPNHSNGLLDPPKVLADVVESLLGAIFMDSNKSLEIVWKAFRRLAEPLIDLEKLGKHPVAELNEFCQKKKLDLKIVKDAWEQNMYVEVLINGKKVGCATYGNKKEICMNRAAKNALDKLKEGNVDLTISRKAKNHLKMLKEETMVAFWSYWRRRASPTFFVVSLLAAAMFQMMPKFRN